MFHYWCFSRRYSVISEIFMNIAIFDIIFFLIWTRKCTNCRNFFRKFWNAISLSTLVYLIGTSAENPWEILIECFRRSSMTLNWIKMHTHHEDKIKWACIDSFWSFIRSSSSTLLICFMVLQQQLVRELCSAADSPKTKYLRNLTKILSKSKYDNTLVGNTLFWSSAAQQSSRTSRRWFWVQQ